MATLELTAEQVVSLVNQLSPEAKRAALLALAHSAAQDRQAREQYAEEQLRRLAAARGRDWDKLTDEEREVFVDDLLHEGKACR
jgi:gamma-glutamyl:cysteine ligase YbdK (ATP-grasp superfamily)